MTCPLQTTGAALTARGCAPGPGSGRASRSGVTRNAQVAGPRCDRPASCSAAGPAGGQAAQPRTSLGRGGLQLCRAAVEFNPTVGSTGTKKSQDAYNKAMQAYSNAPFQYQHEMGLYYHTILPNLIVGTQPVKPSDIDRLVTDEGVTCIFNTQQDKDMAYWNVDFNSLRHRCAGRGAVMARHPFPDFSADGLRVGLPTAVALLDGLLENGHRVYLHCTAGMGRSPGVAIAYLYWCCEHETLDNAYNFLTSRRPCGPNKDAIRKSTCDMMEHMSGGLPQATDKPWPEWQGNSLTETHKIHINNLLKASRPPIPPTSAFSILYKED